MSIKIFLVSFILTSLLFFLIFIPTRLTITIPNSTFKPSMSFFNTTNATNSYPVTFAYLISASKGDSGKLKRLMKALYHPGNYYLIHLDYGAPEAEHRDVVEYVAKDPVFGQLGNVWVVGKRNLVTYRGPTMISTTLHAMAMLLRTCQWDWFINLSASDYPLVTQDDMIQAFSHVPRHINFIHHSSQLGWKLYKRGKPIIIDPGLYSLKKSHIWMATKQRSIPTSFKLYTGVFSSFKPLTLFL
ncbi:beta-glucuronosyltransferase GlcAT14A isoform X1 [Cajanus cajan]|nr:beta-glucuronosyltransferase GlcAT14A isoform X1 [Cajanus cajan]